MKDLELNFKFEIKDWLAFQRSFLEHSKSFKRTKLLVTWMMPIFFLIIFGIDFLNDKLTVFGISFGIIFSILWVLFYPKRMMQLTLKKAKKMMEEGKNKNLLGNHLIEFSEDGIVQRLEASESKMSWEGLEKIVETEDYYFLYNTNLSAIIIPKEKVVDELIELDKILTNKKDRFE